MSREAKNQCLLILSAVTRLEQQLGVCFSSKTLKHEQAGSFMLPGVWSTDSLTPAVCGAINGLYSWASGNAVIPACSLSQKKKSHRYQANMNESYWGRWEKAIQVWVTVEMLWARCWLEVCLRGFRNLTINWRTIHPPLTQKRGYLE